MRKQVVAVVAVALCCLTSGYSFARDTDKGERSGSGTGGYTDTGAGTGGETSDKADMAKGWSAKKMILGQAVYNEKNEKIGKVEDIIISPEKSVSNAIIGVGGFLGMGEHYVSIPINEIKIQEKKITMSKATKEELKKMPKFEYKKK